MSLHDVAPKKSRDGAHHTPQVHKRAEQNLSRETAAIPQPAKSERPFDAQYLRSGRINSSHSGGSAVGHSQPLLGFQLNVSGSCSESQARLVGAPTWTQDCHLNPAISSRNLRPRLWCVLCLLNAITKACTNPDMRMQSLSLRKAILNNKGAEQGRIMTLSNEVSTSVNLARRTRMGGGGEGGRGGEEEGSMTHWQKRIWNCDKPAEAGCVYFAC